MFSYKATVIAVDVFWPAAMTKRNAGCEYAALIVGTVLACTGNAFGIGAQHFIIKTQTPIALDRDQFAVTLLKGWISQKDVGINAVLSRTET